MPGADPAYIDDLSWVSISDFSPGIFSRSRGVFPLGSAGLPAPLGSAQVTNTFACISLPGGGLGPLPKMTNTFDLTLPDTDAHALVGYFNVSGFTAFGPVGPPASNASGVVDDFFVLIEYLNSNTSRRVATLYRLDEISTPPTVDVLETVSSSQAVAAEQYLGQSWAVSRMNPTSPFLSPGSPVVCTSWAPPGFAADRHVWAFPDPSAPATTAAVDLAVAISGRLIAHQNRVIVLLDMTNPFGGHSGDSMPTNEQFDFNDPANSYSGTATIGTQEEVFVAEFPNGYGTYGSISAGELFLVKHQGGGVILTGDLLTPTVTRLPGVVSTGGSGSIAASTPMGLIYYSRNNGVYAWNGSDVATKISDQLEDNFIHYKPAVAAPGSNGLGPDNLIEVAYQFQEWGDWVVSTNGFLLDTNKGSWWRLDNPATYIPQWFARGFFSEDLYAVPLQVNNTSKVGAVRHYSRLVPATTYSWMGHPLPVSVDRTIDVTQIVLVAEGTGTIVVTLTALDGTTPHPETFTLTNNTQPQRLRLNTQCQGYNVVPRIVATGTGGGTNPAPIVHSVAFGYQAIEMAVST